MGTLSIDLRSRTQVYPRSTVCLPHSGTRRGAPFCQASVRPVSPLSHSQHNNITPAILQMPVHQSDHKRAGLEALLEGLLLLLLLLSFTCVSNGHHGAGVSGPTQLLVAKESPAQASFQAQRYLNHWFCTVKFGRIICGQLF